MPPRSPRPVTPVMLSPLCRSVATSLEVHPPGYVQPTVPYPQPRNLSEHPNGIISKHHLIQHQCLHPHLHLFHLQLLRSHLLHQRYLIILRDIIPRVHAFLLRRYEELVGSLPSNHPRVILPLPHRKIDPLSPPSMVKMESIVNQPDRHDLLLLMPHPRPHHRTHPPMESWIW